eukprot:2441763-Amphidinium_carterae.1
MTLSDVMASKGQIGKSRRFVKLTVLDLGFDVTGHCAESFFCSQDTKARTSGFQRGAISKASPSLLCMPGLAEPIIATREWVEG